MMARIEPDATALGARAEQTLLLMHRWGYAPTVEALAAGLIGGGVAPEDLIEAVDRSPRMRADGDFVFLRGNEGLVDKSRRRLASNHALNGSARGIAVAYARDLLRTCPFVDCVALAGSVASGGFASGDDIDFDLFVRAGTKYTSYLLAVLLGLRYSWRYRRLPVGEDHRTPLLPKVTCINVVWPAEQTRPFVRQDVGLAFELQRAEPLIGAERFAAVLADNPWALEHFPQLADRAYAAEPSPPPNAFGRFLLAVSRHPRLLRAMERASRRAAWLLYSFVQGTRRGNPAAVARLEFLRRVKYPYEVFQDS